MSVNLKTYRYFAFCALFCLPLLLQAQSQTAGAIGGTVTDPTGAVIPSATVQARDEATNAVSTTKTDSNGRFTIINLQPGRYEVEISAPGLATARRTDVIVEVGRTTALDTSLSLAGTSASVSVTAEAPVLNTESQDFSTNLNSESIHNLPINGRRWFNFALLTPGAVYDGGFGDISFRGISGLLNNNTVDGGDNNQAFFSEEMGRTRIAYSTSQESIREFQVNTADYSAEYGRAAGGVINAVTKSGSNELHGDLFYYNRDNTFGAYTPFATEPALVNGSYIQVPVKPVDIRQQFGGDIGGYFIKDKLFYYFNYDEQLHDFPAVGTPSNPAALFGPLSSSELATLTSRLGPGTKANLTSAQILQYSSQALGLFSSLSGTVPRTGNQMLSFPKIDYKPNSNHTLEFSYNRLRWDSPYGVQTNSVVARGLDSFGNDYVKADKGVARWTAILTPTITNEMRFEYGRDFEFEYANPPLAGEPLDANGYSPEVDLSGAASFSFGQPYYTPRYAYPEERRTEVADTASTAIGTHLIKFGFDINHVGDQISFLSTSGGDYYYNNRVDFISDYIASQIPAVFAATKGMVCNNGPSKSITPCYNEYQQGFGPLGFNFSTMDYGAFIQDQWRFSPRLTLNLGLRYEYEALPSAQIPNPLFPATSTMPSDPYNWGPRFGFAWDTFGNGKTVVRGGYGIYYGRIINGTIFNAIAQTGSPNGQVQATIFPSTNGAIGPIYPNVMSSFAGSLSKPNIIFFPTDARNPMVQEYDLAIERQIAANTMVSISWVGSLGHFLPIAVDTNLPVPTTINYLINGGPLNGDLIPVPFFKGTRPLPAFNQVTMIDTRVSSMYNAMVLQFNRRFTHGLQFQSSYTWADSVDNGQGTSPTLSGNAPLDAYNLALDRGPSNFDVRHRAVGSLVWQPEYFDHAAGLAHWLLSGWTIAPIITAQTGLPFSATVTGNPPSGSGNAASGVIGAQGSSRVPFLERNSFRYPAVFDTDLRISRAFLFRERVRFELIADAFNLTNHVNYTSLVTQQYTLGGTAATPVLTYSSSFGQLTAANNTNVLVPRQIQLGARISF